MTSDSTTESSPWRLPSGRPTGEGPAPAPPFPETYGPGPSAPGKGMALGALWTGVGSLVLGFLSIGVLGIVGGIVGLVLGMVTLRQANRGTATGSETAIFGMALSLVSIVLGGLLFLSAWPAFVDAFEQGWEQGSQT